MSDLEKPCKRCGETKLLTEFSKAPNTRDGLKSSCKACDAARHRENYIPTPRTRRRGPIDPSEPKTCQKCGLTKTHGDFSLSRKATETQNAVYRSNCKACASASAMQWFADNPERAAASRRKHSLDKNYGLTIQQYNELLRSQNGVCAICGKDEPSEHGRTGKQFRLSVDHCHETGVIRGLLCQKCNRAIGLMNDDPALLRKAISYLLRLHRGVIT